MKLSPKGINFGLGAIAIIAIALNIFFIIHGAKIPVTSEYPLLDPAQATYDKADLLVNMHPLALQLQQIVSGRQDMTIYFQFLNTGSDIRISTSSFFPGSLMKIPIAMAVMKEVERGNWSMNDEFTLTDADKNPDYGDLYKLPAGTQFTIKDLMGELLVQSDDTARNIFVRELGDQNIEDVLDYLGLQDVFNTNETVTAQRYSNFWRALYSAGYLSADDSQRLLQLMAIPHDQDLLYAGIPSSTPFSHKIGVSGYTYSDSGIVYIPGRPYILTVMITSSSTDEVHVLMKEISQDVYNYVVSH